MRFGAPKKIFIVDDDEMLTTALSDYLTRDVKHTIRVFHTGEELMKSLDERPDILILDYYLNAVDANAADGLHVLQTIRKHLPDTRFIMLSGMDSYTKASQTIQHGAEHFVLKGENAFEEIAKLI